MRLGRLFKRRGCAVAAAAALFLCLAAANAEAQDDAIYHWDIQEAIWGDDGAAVVRLVRAKGVDINGIHYISGADSGIPYATALASAVGYGSSNVVKALLDAGADVNARDRFGSTALFYGKHGGITAVRLLINAGADLNMQNDWGNTALADYAQWMWMSDFVKILLDAGADVNIRNNEGLTALMIAEREGNAEIAKLLRGARGYR